MKRLIALLLLAASAAWLWSVRERLFELRGRLPEFRRLAEERAAEAVAELKKEVSAPPPLRAPSRPPTAAALTRNGAIQWTNAHRSEAGLPALAMNERLNAAAEAKLKDMFARQYFAHDSPDGRGPGDLADDAGYEFVAVGENLALGNYDGDKALVQAWMDSPGHRANILAGKFTEIGMAVGKGVFEGETTWLAVQEFGKPLSACPEPPAGLKARIETEEGQLDSLKARADAKRAEIDAMGEPRTRPEAEEYNRKVDEYNSLVRQVNAYIDELKTLVAEYNRQVQAFNACASS